MEKALDWAKLFDIVKEALTPPKKAKIMGSGRNIMAKKLKGAGSIYPCRLCIAQGFKGQSYSSERITKHLREAHGLTDDQAKLVYPRWGIARYSEADDKSREDDKERPSHYSGNPVNINHEYNQGELPEPLEQELISVLNILNAPLVESSSSSSSTPDGPGPGPGPVTPPAHPPSGAPSAPSTKRYKKKKKAKVKIEPESEGALAELEAELEKAQVKQERKTRKAATKKTIAEAERILKKQTQPKIEDLEKSAVPQPATMDDIIKQLKTKTDTVPETLHDIKKKQPRVTKQGRKPASKQDASALGKMVKTIEKRKLKLKPSKKGITALSPRRSRAAPSGRRTAKGGVDLVVG